MLRNTFHIEICSILFYCLISQYSQLSISKEHIIHIVHIYFMRERGDVIQYISLFCKNLTCSFVCVSSVPGVNQSFCLLILIAIFVNLKGVFANKSYLLTNTLIAYHYVPFNTIKPHSINTFTLL